jgi:hypothetical protein
MDAGWAKLVEVVLLFGALLHPEIPIDAVGAMCLKSVTLWMTTQPDGSV